MNQKLRDNVKADFLQITLKFAAYQGTNASPNGPDHTETLKTMTFAVEKMAVVIGRNPSSLEQLTVPNWDGSRRTYQTWKRHFRHCMVKYGQETRTSNFKDFEKRCPKASSEHIKSRPVKALTKPGKFLKLNLQMSQNLWTTVT